MERKLKIFLFIIFVTLVKAEDEFETRWFNSPVDHFSTTDRRRFDIRYLVSENVYRENGPIFIHLSDGPADSRFIFEGNMFEVAEREGGVLIALEQRFFGKSLPTPDASFENLQWLSLNQIAADIGRFANFIKRQYSDAPVILWGSGYGGISAVHARQKYPNVIDGAWASSSPLHATFQNVDYFPNTFRTITQIGGDECGQVITDAFKIIEESFEDGNTSYVEERLMTCGPIDVGNGFDLAFFTFVIASDISNFLRTARYPEVDEKCQILLETSENALDAFARWYIDDFHMVRGTECISTSYEEYTKLFHDPSWAGMSTRFGMRQGYWMRCTQIGQMNTANDGQGHPFGTRFDVRFFRQLCTDAYQNDIFLDPWFVEDMIGDVNRMFGGLDPGTYRTFLTQGEMDPRRSLGPANDLNHLSPVVVIPLQSFARDMDAPEESIDYVVLHQTKLRIQQTVHEWIEYARFGENSTVPVATPYE